ncbi:hypothetical protein [Microbacterium gorillae]|uniref:hypothetical protein n=1 Tax=Microbacterium gorillae TaxID=1231063 RepID=UPI003D958DD3
MTTIDRSHNIHDTKGRFAGKINSAPATGLGATEAVPSGNSTRGDLQLTHATLFRESEEAALDFIHTTAPEGAVSATFIWSDEGSWIELTHFEMEGGRRISVEDVIWGDNEHDLDVELYEDMSSAAMNVESPFERGLSTEDDGATLHLDLTRSRPRGTTIEQLNAINERTREAQAAVELAVVQELRDHMPGGATRLRLESDRDQGTLTLVGAFDENGTAVDITDQVKELNDIAAAIAATPSLAAQNAGLHAPEGYREADGVYDLEANAAIAATADDDYQQCSRCGDDVHSLSSDGLCDGCVEELETTTACPNCGERVDNDEMNYVDTKNEMCDSCVHNAIRSGWTPPNS